MHPSEQVNKGKYYLAKQIFDEGGKLSEAKKATDPAAAEVVHRVEKLLQRRLDIYNKRNRLTGADRIRPFRECIEFNSRVRDENVPTGIIKYSTLLKYRQLLTMCIYASEAEIWDWKIESWNSRIDHSKLIIDERYCCEDLRNFIEFFKDICHQHDVEKRCAFILSDEEQDRILKRAKTVHPVLHNALQKLFIFKDTNDFLRTLGPFLSSRKDESAVPI